ncbi:MAG: hypothetical protein P4L28_05590 [Paludibacteraceae bacterium]|nr:hypothetical protein [Paludibacteraceae bacterium]
MKKQISILLISILVLASCSKNRFKINTDKVDLNVKIERFDQDFMQMNPAHLNESVLSMRKKYGDFFDRYTANIVRMGSPDSANYIPRLTGFLRDSMVREVFKETQKVFANVSDIQKETNDAFKYVKYYFPEKKIPRIAMHISGFNQSIVATKDILSISIDNYLGADYAPYKGIVYEYQLQNMTRSKVAPDILLGYLMSEFPVENTGSLLGCILSRAKILYLQSIFMPQRPEQDVMGYTKAQEDWCVKNEKNMWNFLVENRQLYNTSQLICAKYINPAPFTSYFTQDSPGQAGIWIGVQIIKSYMDHNTSVTLPELMKDTNYQRILEESKYKP